MSTPSVLVHVDDKGNVKKVAGEDVPPVLIDVAIEHAKAEKPVAPLPAASDADAFAAMQAAVQRGVALNDIVPLLAERKVARVNQLTPDDRASFVAAISKLGVTA